MKRLIVLLTFLTACASESGHLLYQSNVKRHLSKEFIYSDFQTAYLGVDSLPEMNRLFCEMNQCCHFQSSSLAFNFSITPLGKNKNYKVSIHHITQGKAPEYLNVDFRNAEGEIVFFKRLEEVSNQRDTISFLYQSRGDEYFFGFDYEKKIKENNPLLIEVDTAFLNDYGKGFINQPCSLACFNRTIKSVSFTSIQ